MLKFCHEELEARIPTLHHCSPCHRTSFLLGFNLSQLCLNHPPQPPNPQPELWKWCLAGYPSTDTTKFHANWVKEHIWILNISETIDPWGTPYIRIVSLLSSESSLNHGISGLENNFPFIAGGKRWANFGNRVNKCPSLRTAKHHRNVNGFKLTPPF